MAAAERKSDVVVSEALVRDAAKFDFFRAVQILQRLAPGAVPVGEIGPPNEEAIRFAHDPSMVFNASDVAKIEPRVVRNGHVFARLTTTFLGYTGPASPLANHVTETVLRAEASDEHSLREFYDLFHHRILSLLFRAWKKYRFGAGFRSDASDAFTKRALCLVGVDVAGAVSRQGLPPGDMLGLSLVASQRTRPAWMLQLVLERVFPGAQVAIESFVARRVRIGDEQIVRLGKQNTTLGQDLTIGRHVIDRSGAFRVVVGPVGYDLFEAFLPGGLHHERLRRIVDQFSGGVLESELELRLSPDSAPRFQLGSRRGAVLGSNTHLVQQRTGAMRVRVVLGGDAVRARPRVVTEGEGEQRDAAE